MSIQRRDYLFQIIVLVRFSMETALLCGHGQCASTLLLRFEQSSAHYFLLFHTSCWHTVAAEVFSPIRSQGVERYSEDKESPKDNIWCPSRPILRSNYWDSSTVQPRYHTYYLLPRSAHGKSHNFLTGPQLLHLMTHCAQLCIHSTSHYVEKSNGTGYHPAT